MDEELVITKSLNCDPLHLIKCPGGLCHAPWNVVNDVYAGIGIYKHCALCIVLRSSRLVPIVTQARNIARLQKKNGSIESCYSWC